MTSKQQLWSERMVAEGRCRTCGKKVKSGARCPRHAKMHAANQRRLRAAKKAQQVSS